eukprot:7359726-Prymnesium_polylepis.3
MATTDFSDFQLPFIPFMIMSRLLGRAMVVNNTTTFCYVFYKHVKNISAGQNQEIIAARYFLLSEAKSRIEDVVFSSTFASKFLSRSEDYDSDKRISELATTQDWR